MIGHRALRVWVIAAACGFGTAIVLTQGQPAPQPPGTPAAPASQTPPPSPPARGAGGGRGTPEQQMAAQIAAGADFLKRPPVVRLSPEAEQKLFLLPPGYKIELVLSDPDIQDPVGVTFDGNGRMYVLEMRSYMQDADGSTARAPISRISRHEDTDGDGVYDRHTVFADNLVMPRIAFPLGDGVILALETDNRDLYKYTDTNGDGVADKKEVFYPGVGRVQNMEWQPGGMTWALDNWLYTTYNPFRLRIAPNGTVLREETEPNGGQWWSAQDNYGKTWWVDGGGEIGPVNFQAPIVYGAFNVPDNFEPDFQVPWPAPGGIADMQGGMGRVRLPEGTLNHFTAAAGPEIYRGDRLPADLGGDLLFNEPVARIVRRAKIVADEGLTQLRNAYPKSEFVRSTDPLFRPVGISNAPDGTLYLSDMYTGIIQDAQFVGQGSYLRRKVDQYELDKHHNWGRIWRITYEGMAPNRERPRMYAETPAELVRHLEHASGWWRDTAQKLLVLKQDKSVAPALRALARSSSNQLARIHALWTLEGLGSLDAVLTRELMKSPDPKIRIQAIRASESLYKAGDKTFAADYRGMAKDGDPEVVIQALLTANLQKVSQYAELIRSTIAGAAARGVREIGGQLLRPGQAQGQRPSLADTGASVANLSVEQRRIMQRGEGTYRELCTTCHGPDGKGAPMGGAPAGTTLAPPLAASPRVLGHRDYVINVLLHGLTGPVADKEYAGGVMAPMGGNTNEWIADVASYVRNSFGNAGPFVTPEQVAAIRQSATRKTPWTSADLERAVPALLTNTTQWKVAASHNADAAANVLASTTRWDSGAPQQPGMWFQIELPESTPISEIQIESAVAGAGRGFGGRAGGAAGAGSAPGAAPAAPAGAGAGAAAPAAGVGAPGAGGGRASAAPPEAAAAPPPAARGGFGGGRGGPPAAGPVAYSVQVSADGTTWSAPVAQGVGSTPTTLIAFKQVPAKFVRITQTGAAQNGELWAIQQVRVYRAGAAR